MEGFGLRGVPDDLARFIVDDYIGWVWSIYAGMVVLAFVTFLVGSETQSVRAGRVFLPLTFLAVALAFVTPT